MKHFIGFCLIQLLAVVVVGQQYKATDEGSSIKFRIKNFGIETGGSFTGLEGTISFDPKDLTRDSFDLSVDARSVNTDNNMRDNHLRKEDYLDVQNYPRIRFVSTKVTVDNNAHFTVTGKLTIKNTTQEITIPFTATPKNEDYIFAGEFRINRKDFKVGGSSTISNGLTVQFSVLAKKR
ncbi:YceI family protein [Flavitalea sp. BT771]|uniref:YceI family protein n=1 Tax=Flavitalea sp. BT771 TaxID=3063329 RepID=UPI0026E3A172|nr:YceI family protein [Flavitalea sp. BT771]MDO6431616.1 YceI family protein [Flavitalea sp. BT771]MDV6220524.1 YceI family protein [Flavitalea sp. BT771]